MDVVETVATDLSTIGSFNTLENLLARLTVPSQRGTKPTLDRMRWLLAELGNPEANLPVLHIGGTSGKGSTATIAAHILREAGYRVGLHVKPHLESVTERFIVDGIAITPEKLIEYLERISSVAPVVRPTWYELTLAIGLQYFRDQNVDITVVEVGLGGTHDGTNVVEPSATVLTNVGLDHTEILGDTIEKIVRDKAGIIKSKVPAISGVIQPSARAIVSRRCRAVGAPLWQLGKEIKPTVSTLTTEGATFDLRLPSAHYAGLQLDLVGSHQVVNASLAVAAVGALSEGGYPVTEEAIRRALRTVRVPGRFEVIRQSPIVLLDGAHNPDKMQALVDTLRTVYAERPIIAVLGFKRGHDLAATLAPILDLVSHVVLTEFDADTDFGRSQSVPIQDVAGACARINPRVKIDIEPDPVRATQLAIAESSENGLVCVTGSLYLVGAVRSRLRDL